MGRGRGSEGLGPLTRPPDTLFQNLLEVVTFPTSHCCHVSKRYHSLHDATPPRCSCLTLMHHAHVLLMPHAHDTPPLRKRQLRPLSWCVEGMLRAPRLALESLLLVPPAAFSLCTEPPRQELHVVHLRLPTSPLQYCILST